jgi:MYXO-CTERM domain-containing protein
MSVFTFARATRAALVFSVLLLAAPGCAPDADLPAATSGEGSAAPAPDTGAVSTPEDVKEDVPNSDAGADAADILSLDVTDGTRTQGTLGLTSFSYCNTDLDCPVGMDTCVTELQLNGTAPGGNTNKVGIKTLPGFGVIPANKAGVCSLGCTDHPEVCTGLRVGADTTAWSCQLVYAGASPYVAGALPAVPALDPAKLTAGVTYGSLCRPPFERAAAYTPDFCDSCSAADKCENSSACIDDAFYSDTAADQRTGHCLVACDATTANACPTGFACRIPGTGESQLGTPKEGTFCFPTLGTCTSCLDRDGDGVGVGGCTVAGGASAVDCNDTDAEIYFDAAEPDHAFPGSCGPNLDANCNGLSDDKEQIGVTDEDGNLIYGAEHCGSCFSACSGSEGVGEAASRRTCEVTGQGGAFGNLSACRPSCDYPDLRADCNTGANDGCETQIDGRASLSIRDCDSDGHGDALATAADLLFDCDGLGVTAVNPRDGSSCSTVRVLRTGPYGDDCDDTQDCVNPGETEVCDGYDNDCDGRGDESVVGWGQDCTVAASNVDVLGACRNGFRLCGPGTEGLICGASLPTTESCDGIDNDCDGVPDDGVLNRCGTCGPLPVDVCNGRDDDCDDRTDEGVLNACGACGDVPSEVCNCSDDDCDRQIDEGMNCPACDCAPSPEVCDGRDNDCDNEVDDGVLNRCGQCGLEPAEICNRLDDDCDGRFDEAFPEQGVPCGTNEGECVAGIPTCVDGEVICRGEVAASPEVCDGLDNNCDGEIDEGAYNTCGYCGNARLEVCDNVDNDCEGSSDQGVLCRGEDACVNGECAPPCQFGECVDDLVCVGGFCVSPCYNTDCADGFVCQDGRCADPCDGIACPAGTYCSLAQCIPDDCYGPRGCPDGQRCQQGQCQADPCATAGCGPEQGCQDGRCFDSCDVVQCAAGEVCQNGACVNDPCARVVCEYPLVCDGGGCVPDPCFEVDCGPGFMCEAGQCVEDPCGWTVCPEGYVCHRGECAAGDGASGPGSLGAGNDAGFGTGNDPNAQSKRFITGDGCGCNAQATSSSSVAGLLALGVIGVIRRRRSRGV